MFAPQAYPPAGAESITTGKLLIAALKAGWVINVISHKNSGRYYPSNPNGLWSVIPKILHDIDTTRFSKLIGASNVFPNISLNRLESLIWVIKAVVTGRRLLKQYRYDFILSRIMPEYGHLPALILSYWFNIPWIANWSDPMPQKKAYPPYGKGSKSNPPLLVNIYCRMVEKKAVWHTFPSERLRKYVCSYLPDCSNKSSCIPHVALEHFQANSPKSNLGFSICHVGSLGLRKPDVFLEGIKRFLKNTMVDEPFSVKFIGFQMHKLMDTIQKFGLDHIVSLEEAITYEETIKIMADSSVLVVIEADSEEGIFFPSKFIDFVQSGRPILAVSPVVGTLTDIISANGGGIAVDCRSPVAIAKAIENLYSEWKAGTLDNNYGSCQLLDLFSEQHVLYQYTEIFKRIGV